MKKIVIVALCIAIAAASFGCANRAQSGAGVGALSGALIGSLVSGNKLVGAGIGAGIGLALGYIIGNEWEKYDQQRLNRTLETNRTGQTSTWRNPDTGAYYEATPTRTYTTDERVYRDVKLKAEVDGQEEVVYAKAYRQPDGSWRLVQD
jgi:surface antigen